MTANLGGEPPEGVGLQAAQEMSKAASYAGALIELAGAEADPDRIDHDLRLAARTFLGHLDLKNTLKDSTLPSENKDAVIDEIFGDQVSRLTMNFLRLLVGMDQIELLPEVADEYAKRLESSENKAIAEVTTAVPLEGEFAAQLTKKLSEMIGKNVTLRARVDPEIVGGIVVKVEGKLLDGSVRNQLERLRAEMLEG